MSEGADTVAALLQVLEDLAAGVRPTPPNAGDSEAVSQGRSLATAAFERADRAPREDSLFLESIVENLPAMLFVKDAADLRFVRFNRAGEQLLGLRSEDLIGKSDHDFFPQDEADFFIGKDREVLASGTLLDIPEEPVHTPDRGTRWLHTRKIPIHDATGTPAFLLGISEDITDRKAAQAALVKAQEELLQREAWLSLLLQVFPGVVWSADHELRFTALAGAQLTEMGLSAERSVGEKVSDLLPAPQLSESRSEAPGDPPLTLDELHRVALLGAPVTYEFALRDRSYEVRLEPLVPEQRLGVLAMALDVTERRRLELERAEARLQQAQKLESLGLLAGGIAHDFNNLLVGVLGNASLALAEIGPDSPARDSIQRIESAAERAADLTRQMLAYSGRGRFVVEAVDLSVIVRRLAQLLEVSVPKRTKMEFELEEDLPLIEADVAQIHQVVMNLITNAADALEDGRGSIKLETSKYLVDAAFAAAARLDAGALLEGLYVRLEVRDTGRGMDLDTRARMFDPFFTTRSSGHGLGLAAVLGIIRGHRGAIQVRSAPQRGTTIVVWLPATTASSSQLIPTLDAFDLGPGGRVLVADDEPAVTRFARAALERAGFSVDTVEDGAQALAAFEAEPDEYGVVLLDLTMPVMDGEETFHALRAIRPGVRVLLSSGYSEQEATSRFTGRGLAGFLQKPYRAAELIAKIQELQDAAGPHEME